MTGQDTELVRWLAALRTLSAAATSEADPHGVLNLVAATARDLLGFDFCGVLIPNAARDRLLITGWDGLSAEYVDRVNSDRAVRLDGTAPSSRAFHGGRPVAIADITAEAGFAPWGGVAREQDYRAIVCVPLIAGTEVLGTLNGYYRPEHEFSAEEIERLTLLANHAAIAVTSARLLDELRSLTASLREQRDALTRSEQIHQRLLAVTLRSGGIDGIATALAELVGGPVLIDDAHHQVLTGDSDALPGPDVRAAVDVDASSTPVRVVGSDGTAFLVSAARLGGDVAARIWLPDLSLDAIGIRAVEHASLVVALELLRVRTGVEVEHRLRGDLVVELLTNSGPPSQQLMSRAELLGHDLSAPHATMVAALGPSGQNSQRALSTVSDALRSYRPRPLTAMYRGDVLVLWPTAAGAATDAAALVQRRLKTTVALDETGSTSYAHAYRMTKGALDVALGAGSANTVVRLADLGVAGLLLQLDDPAQLLGFAERALGPLLDYDRRHRTDLLETLSVYLRCRLDRARTATELHIHPNTVGQRIRRIEQLCSTDLGDPAAAAHFSTALTVRTVGLRGAAT